MGYQESLITSADQKDFNKLITRVRQLGKNYYSRDLCSIPSLVTTKRKAYLPYEYKRGSQFLYVTGDRRLQRCEDDFLFLDWDEDLGFDLEITFIEEIGHDGIKKYLCDKDGWIYPGVENIYVTVEKFEFQAELFAKDIMRNSKRKTICRGFVENEMARKFLEEGILPTQWCGWPGDVSNYTWLEWEADFF